MSNSVSAALMNDLVRLVLQGLVLAVGYGLIAMSAIQFLKDILLRESFNRRSFNRWFKDMQGSERARQQLIWLSAAGDEQALFSLTIDKMAGQIAVAAATVLEAPKRYSELLSVLAFSKEFEKTFETERESPRSDPTPLGTPAAVDDGSQLADLNLLISTDLASLSTADSATLRIQYADARTRVGHRVQRQIDLLQLKTTQHWMKTNQGLSLVLAGCIGCLPLFLRGLLNRHYGVLPLIAIVPPSVTLSLLGGWFAPILRDLVAHQSRAE